MDVIYGLIPAMIFLGLVMVFVLIWAVKSGQYEDLEGDANRILMDDDDPLLPNKEMSSKGVKSKSGSTQQNSKQLFSDQPRKESGKNWPDAD